MNESEELAGIIINLLQVPPSYIDYKYTTLILTISFQLIQLTTHLQ